MSETEVETPTFKKGFDSYVCDGDFIEAAFNGVFYRATIVRDDDVTPPWKSDDGYGPVSEWTSRTKRAGERILNRDHDAFRYYDFEEAVRIAARDGWDSPPYGQGTPGEKAARAAESDFRFLKAWCDDKWHYVGVVLQATHIRTKIILFDGDVSLWRIECNAPGEDNSYLKEVADELLPEAIAVADEKLSEIRLALAETV